MATVSRTPYTDRAVQAATFATRAVVAAGIPAYLFFTFTSIQSPSARLIGASIAVLSAPSTLYCALGALEGVVRSCKCYFDYRTKDNPDFQWDQFTKEVRTTFGLAQGTLSPPSGYAVMYREWNKLSANECNPRVLKEEYFVYSIPRSAGHKLVEAGKWSLTKLQQGFNWTIEALSWAANATISLIQRGWQATLPFRQFLWNGCISIGNWSIDRLIDVWNFTEPLRTLVKIVVWDFLIQTLFVDLILNKLVWQLAIKTIIWNVLLKTIIGDWIITKLIWNFMIEILLVQVIWPPIRFIGENMILPILKWTVLGVGTIIAYAFSIIRSIIETALRR